MKFSVREMKDADRSAWIGMRAALWPDDSRDAHAEAIGEFVNSQDNWALIAEMQNGDAAGFAEIAIRKYANGCDTRPVPFLEGIWVNPKFRRCGIGASLIRHAEALLIARGFREIGSDTQIDNRPSQAAHLAWGFSETERVVYFRKILKTTIS